MAPGASAAALDQLPPSDRTLRQAQWWMVVGAVASIASLMVVPASVYIPAAALPLWGYGCWRIGRQRRRDRERRRQLGQRRGFQFLGNAIPQQPSATMPTPGTAPCWHPEWVPYRMVKQTVIRDGVAAVVQRKVLEAPAAWLAVLEAQRAWLRTHAPRRWRVVQAWWHAWHVAPLVARRQRGTAEAEAMATLRAEAARELGVELRIAVAVAGQVTLWGRTLGIGPEVDAYADLCRRLAPLRTDVPADAPPFPRQALPVRDHWFIGRGFACEPRHTQRLEDLKLQDLSEVTSAPAEQGDPRIYGIGHAEAHDLFLEEVQFNQMAGIFGSTGVGKTRYAEALLVQVIRQGLPLIIVDPKSDQVLTNRVVEECRRSGRGHQFRYLCLAAPTEQRTWAYLARYNPCSAYTDPAELADRIAAVLPSTSDPFWGNVAKGMVETCLTLCHWANWYLRFLGRAPDGTLAPRAAPQVPRLLLALQWARHHREASPADAEAALTELERQRADPAWTPQTPAEQEIVELLRVRSLEGAPIYSPLEWLPSVRHVTEYEIDNTTVFLGWMLRLFFPHLYLYGAAMAGPAFPRQAANAEILAKGMGNGEPSMWALYQAQSRHPLEARVEAQGQLAPELQRWQAFYDHFVPARPDDGYTLARMFTQVRKCLDTHYSDCTKERQKFLEYATTLQSALKPFTGELARIMCAIDSDIVWDQLLGERQVIYCALAGMINQHGAKACAKMLIQDLAAYYGRRYQYVGGATQPVYLFADEIGTWINAPFIDLLNKCRGVGLRAIIAGQTRADLVKELGKEGAQQALSNLNTLIQLRSPEAQDAREFAERTGEVRVVQESRNITITPGIAGAGNTLIHNFSANESRGYNQQTVKRIPVDAVLALPRGQAFVHTKGQVFLVAQGMLSDPQTNFYEEIGMQPGVMVDPLLPPSATTTVDPLLPPAVAVTTGPARAPSPGPALAAPAPAPTTSAATKAECATSPVSAPLRPPGMTPAPGFASWDPIDAPDAAEER